MTARAAAWAYGYPLFNPATKTGYTGAGYTGGIIELGGCYNTAQVAAYFSSFGKDGYPIPVFTDVLVGQGVNGDGTDPDGADGEVQLDMLIAAAVAPGAAYRVYFADQSNESFLAALTQALAECDGVSLSWGGSENTWDAPTMQAFEAVIKAAKAKGKPLFVAAGDNGSGDASNDGSQVDFPASSPSSIGCGGTRLTLSSNGHRAAEVTWDDNAKTDATGGGVSQQFPGRQVPDIAGNADPDSGYEVVIDGRPQVIGGTSAVAPLMLAGHALLWEACKGAEFDYLGLLTGTPNSFFDVTIGDNGAYRAGPGRDDVTGLGVPNLGPPLTALLAKLGIPDFAAGVA
jgi:kumamolisin